MGTIQVQAFKPHHLELFYYVARHGGISAATRHMPYGIGQPAISGQMADLEHQLGQRLFERKPFQLTAQGRLLYAHLEPFYSGLGLLWQKIQDQPAQVVSIATDDFIGPELLPAILAQLDLRPSGRGYELRTGPSDVLETWLNERRVHLAITYADRRLRGFRSLELGQPGLRLLVRRKTKIKTPGYFWRQERITEPLICPVEAGAMLRTFERGVQALGVVWPVIMGVDSAAVMHRLVAAGQGVGLSLELPFPIRHPEVRAIPLAGFDPVPVVAAWHPSAEPQLGPLLSALRDTAMRWRGRKIEA